MKPDDRFLADFAVSLQTVETVADWLRGRGYEVYVPVPVLRPDASQRFEFRDPGDIKLRHDGCYLTVEVKYRALSFTCADDYKYGTIMVDEVYKLTSDRLGRLAGYAIVNRARTYLAWIPGSSEPYWGVESKYDAAQNRPAVWRVCPKYLACFYPIVPAFSEVA